MLFVDNKSLQYSPRIIFMSRAIFLFIIVGLTGCVTSSGVSAPPTIPGQQQGQSEPSVSDKPDKKNEVSSRGVIDGLISQGRRALSNKNPLLAIEQAERGIRIDRTEPELYLLLAQAYNYVGDGLKAANFARQGLRYVSNSQFLLRQKLQKFTQN